MKEKTHFRKAFKSPYLSSADIVEPTTLTISHVRLESDQTKKTKDAFNTAYFVEKEIRSGEPLKPMILNAVNSRTLKDLIGSPFIDDWCDTHITVYVDPNVRFGRDTVEGLRISSIKPTVQKLKPLLTPESDKWSGAVQSVKDNGTADIVCEHMTLSEEHLTQLHDEAGI
ncbi:MAG: hypothetical protein R8M45_07945 [Ghiorsea sp.]